MPYGRPLANQQFYVLNSRLEPCPAWVTGELYIGGKGLARGYWSDRAKTTASFITHPQFGRLYKTGDLGRWRDGSIELLGRADFQVKVNGYRIELGEIETVLQQHPAIQTAVVTAIDNSLAAYIVPQPVAKIERKLSQANLRESHPDDRSIALPLPDTSIDLRRQSYRQFLPDSIALTQLSNLLGSLRQQQIDHAPLPKHRYASAGSLYPVQTYVLIRDNCVTGLEAGVYYYHPADHRLVWLNAAPAVDYGSNRSIFEQSAFSLFLVGQLAAIAPVYADKARDFCLLEAGYMSQLLMETAPDFDLGLCPIGALPFEPLQQAMQLEPSQILLHSLVGGAIDPAWTTQWNPPAPAPILDQIREFLRQKLPAYMIPSRFQFLEALPLTANGKLDRRSLPQFAPDRPAESIAPQTEIERAIAQIWQQALQVEAIGIHDDFFELGGNSLSATQVITQMRQTFQAEVSIRQFFTAPTIAAQAQMLRPVEAIAPIPKVDRSPDIDQLSDQEVDALLNQLLAEDS
ncbi:MAG: AMP-binding protein [Leptolyngbyaceae cyanobacterium SM1_3_5]|nr:AMP-binding protein [Leptolyngbyaceae cyanobacterium SM1_3_5]